MYQVREVHMASNVFQGRNNMYIIPTHWIIKLFWSDIASPGHLSREIISFQRENAQSLYTGFPVRGAEGHVIMFSSAFGSLGHFRESFVNFARLLKLPLLTRYKDQILVAGRMCSEFCEVIQESVLSSLLCALCSRKKPPELSWRSLKFISKFLVTRLTGNSGLYHFHF